MSLCERMAFKGRRRGSTEHSLSLPSLSLSHFPLSLSITHTHTYTHTLHLSLSLSFALFLFSRETRLHLHFSGCALRCLACASANRSCAHRKCLQSLHRAFRPPKNRPLSQSHAVTTQRSCCESFDGIFDSYYCSCPNGVTAFGRPARLLVILLCLLEYPCILLADLLIGDYVMLKYRC